MLNTARRGSALPHGTIHDLRRSFATHVNELGFATSHVVERILNHVSGAKANVASTYNRAMYLHEKRQALACWKHRLVASLERLDLAHELRGGDT